MPELLDPPTRTTRPVKTSRRDDTGKYLYICAEDASRVEEVESYVVSAIPRVQDRVQTLTYTDPEEFASHARKTLVANVRSVVGICIGVTPKTIDPYFAILCSIALELLPKFETKGWHIELRLALCSLYTFARSGEEFSLSTQNSQAWSDFLDIRQTDGESAWDIHTRFLQPLFKLDEEAYKLILSTLIGLRIGMD